MSTEKKVDVEVIKEVPELEGLEDLVKKVLDIDIFSEDQQGILKDFRISEHQCYQIYSGAQIIAYPPIS